MTPATLPQLDRLFLTDAGLETDLLFNRGIDLPHFASVILLKTDEGRQALNDYFRGFLDLAKTKNCGIVLEMPPGGQVATGRPRWDYRKPNWMC